MSAGVRPSRAVLAAPLPLQQRRLAVRAGPVHPDRDRARAARTRRRRSSSRPRRAGVIPTAALMGRATEELAARSGPGIGGFLNVTFGNAPELIIAFFALNEGLQEVVKASLDRLHPRQRPARHGRRHVHRRPQARAPVLRPHGGERAGAHAAARRRRARSCRRSSSSCAAPGLPRPDAEAVNYDSDVEKISVGTAIILLRHVRRGPVLLAAHPQGPLQPGARRGGPRARMTSGP